VPNLEKSSFVIFDLRAL